LGELTFSNDFFGISLSGVKYFTNRNTYFTFSEFKEEGIHNLMNNKYSFDKAAVTFTLTLNTVQEKLVEFISIDVKKEIYPTFFEALY
jgi:hypothetical protein